MPSSRLSRPRNRLRRPLSSAAALRLSLALVVIGTALGAAFAFPYLRGSLWIHLRRAAPEGYVLPLPALRVPQVKPGFGAPRAHGPHEGIDLFAPAGTPVLAVAEGIVIENRPTPIGGNIVWVLGSARRLYYYAHLSEVAPGARRGSKVAAGERVGAVGNTGNAASTPPHLHFAIYSVTSNFLPLRYEARDPYPLLLAHGRTIPAPILLDARSDAPPRAASLPISPVEAFALSPQQIAEHAEHSAARLASFLATLDPFVGLDADGDVRRVERIYALPQSLRRKAADLRESQREHEVAPLRDLAAAAREPGRRLFAASQQLELVLDERDRCAPHELGALLGALETLALALEQAAASPGELPHSDYYFFEGRPPGVVPAEGGWLVVVGPEIGRGGAPSIDLVVEEREDALAHWRARRLGDDAIAVRIGPELVADHLGTCLALRMDAHAGPGLPICLPASYGSQYRIRGQLAYRKAVATRTLDSDELVFINRSCTRRQRVSKTLDWVLQPGGRMIDPGRGDRFQVGDASIDCRLDAGGVTCTGTLGPATCAGGETARADTEWHQIFAPIEEYPDPALHRSAVLADPVDVAPGATQACVDIPRDDPSEQTSMWFELFAVNGQQQQVVFSSPRESVSASAHMPYQAGPHGIDAELHPQREPGTAAICVTVRSPECRV